MVARLRLQVSRRPTGKCNGALVLTLLTLFTNAHRTTLATSRPDEPTAISMRLRDVPAREAYAAIAGRTGVIIRYTWGPPSEKDRVTATIVHEPFWSAMARIGKTAKMQVTHVRREPAWEIWLTPHHVMSTHKPVATSVDGLFIATLYDHVTQELLRAPDDPTRLHASQLSVSIRAEPKIKAMMWHSIRVEEFVDDAGRPLPDNYQFKTPVFHDGTATIALRVKQRPWPRRVGRLTVTGKVLASLKSELAQLDDMTLEAPAGVSAGGLRIEAETRKGQRGRAINLTMTREVNVTPDWLRPASRLALLEPIVLDPDGRKYLLHTYDRDWFGRMCRFRLEAEAPSVQKGDKPYGPPHRLVMEVPTEVVEYDVRFEFSDVNLF